MGSWGMKHTNNVYMHMCSSMYMYIYIYVYIYTHIYTYTSAAHVPAPTSVNGRSVNTKGLTKQLLPHVHAEDVVRCSCVGPK